jgi:hypothetical protein
VAVQAERDQKRTYDIERKAHGREHAAKHPTEQAWGQPDRRDGPSFLDSVIARSVKLAAEALRSVGDHRDEYVVSDAEDDLADAF